jgi:hypothetical protein
VTLAGVRSSFAILRKDTPSAALGRRQAIARTTTRETVSAAPQEQNAWREHSTVRGGATSAVAARLTVPEELVGLLLSDPALLDEELRELRRDLFGAVLDVGLDGLRDRGGQSDPAGRRRV